MAFNSTGVWCTSFATTLGATKRLAVVSLGIADPNEGLTEVALCFPRAVTDLRSINLPEAGPLFTQLFDTFRDIPLAPRGGSSKGDTATTGLSTTDNDSASLEFEQSVESPPSALAHDDDEGFVFRLLRIQHRKLSFKEKHIRSPGRGVLVAYEFNHAAIVHPGIRSVRETVGNPSYYTLTTGQFLMSLEGAGHKAIRSVDQPQEKTVKGELPLGALSVPADATSLTMIRTAQTAANPIFSAPVSHNR